MSAGPLRLVGTNEEREAVLDQALAQMREHESATLVADFDAAYAEYRREETPHLVRFGGRNFEIPRTVRLDFAMFYTRHCLSRRGGQLTFVVPEERMGEFVEKMLGQEFAAHAERRGVEFGFVLQRIVPDILRLWGIDVQTLAESEKKTTSTPGS